MSGAVPTVRVMIAEDDAAVRETLSALVASEPGLELVGAAADADEAISLAEATLPEVAIVDVHMPGGGGPRATREIKRCAPETKVVALSGSDDRTTVLEMLEAGSVGYVVKGGSAQSIIEAIERAASGQASLSVEVTGDVIEELVEQLGSRRRAAELLKARRKRIERALTQAKALAVVGQPIRSLETGETVGVEALARFAGPPTWTPDRWFAEASEVGLREALELEAVARALARIDELPESIYFSLNVSPSTIGTAAFRALLADAPAGRVVLEITEHAPIEDYGRLKDDLAAIRELGVRVAIDDAGAGFASLRHILQLVPEFIKLDLTLVAGVEHDPSQQALAAGLISFANAIDATLVAEGVENAEDAGALLRLGVRYGQGYHLGRPSPEFVSVGHRDANAS